MNLETWQTELESLDTFKLDKPLGEFEQDKIKNILRQRVIDLAENWDTDSRIPDFDSIKETLNLVSADIQDYLGTGNNSSVNKTLENYSVETQVKDFQHSNICSCSSCCGNLPNAQNSSTQGSQLFENVAFFNAPGSKWSQPGGKGNPVNITYSFRNLLDGGLNGISAEQAEASIEEAFKAWSSVAPLNFTEVQDSSSSQIRIGYDYIDGPSNTLAFAYFPTNGDITFDSGDRWNPSLFLETAVHEIGHSLGLDHERGTDAIMNPTIQNRYNGLGTAFLLQDDINGIRSLYGSGRGSVNPLDGNPIPTPTPTPTPTPSGPRRIDGTLGEDVLMGNDRNNVIRGFAGNDYLQGGKGDDILKGGQGEDTFAFKSLDGSVDTIKDFSIAEGDRLEVSRAGFGSGSGFAYDSSSGSLSFNNQEFIVLENKPSFSDVSAGFVVT